jgi:hypothetical protein
MYWYHFDHMEGTFCSLPHDGGIERLVTMSVSLFAYDVSLSVSIFRCFPVILFWNGKTRPDLRFYSRGITRIHAGSITGYPPMSVVSGPPAIFPRENWLERCR